MFFKKKREQVVSEPVFDGVFNFLEKKLKTPSKTASETAPSHLLDNHQLTHRLTLPLWLYLDNILTCFEVVNINLLARIAACFDI
jgi:hypothetical protein